MVGDNRQLNNLTLPDRYSMPYIHYFIRNIGGGKYLTKLDLSAPTIMFLCREKTPRKQLLLHAPDYMSLRGCRHASNTFQRLMDSLFGQMEFVIAYIDDIMLASLLSEREHHNHINQVLQVLKDNDLAYSVEKSEFCKSGRKKATHRSSNYGDSSSVATHVHYSPKRVLFLTVDESDKVIGGVLEQEEDQGNFLPLGFFSKALNATQAR
nr:uncharacterized protein LOC121123580 [Lepeophtheirus salmonis]